MTKKTYLFVKRGLIADPKHRESMGNRVWLYMHIIDRADWESGQVFEWRDKDEADDLSMPWRTVQRQRQELEDMGYISCQQARRGLTVTIHNWVNPKTYSGDVLNRKPKGTQKSVPTEDEGTHEGTQQGTQQVDTNLSTPTLNQISNIKYQIGEKNTHLPASEPKPEKPRDELFDAIANTCRLDPKLSGSTIAKVKVLLDKAGYTVADVKAFDAHWWSWKDRTDPPTVWKLKDGIAAVKAGGKRPAGKAERVHGRPAPRILP
jgi:hypothetical protein